MKYFILNFFCLILPAFIYSQNNKTTIDSLEKLTAIQRDSNLAKTYNELTWQYRMVDREIAISYGKKAIELANKINYPASVAQAYNDLGIIYYDKENYDSAIQLYQHALELRSGLNDELGIAKLYNKIGIVYQKQGLFEKAEEAQLKALTIFKKFNNDFGISYSLNNIGILNQNMGRYKDAIKYHQQSILLKEKIKDKVGLAGSYVNIGNIYIIEKKYEEGKKYYLKGVEMCRELGDKEYLSNALNNLSNAYLKTRDFENALIAVNESYKIRESLGDTKGMVSCLNNKATIFMGQNKFDTAETILTIAKQKAINAVNCKPELNAVYLNFAELYELQSKPEAALSMYKLFVQTRDSLFTEGLSKNFAEQETKYKTLEKEKQIQQQQFEISKRNYWIAGIISLLLLGSLLGYSYYKSYKLKQQARFQEAIMNQQEAATKAVIEAEENERKRIAGDLHDGVGQMMSAAKMNLSAIESNLIFASIEHKNNFQKVVGLIDESCAEVRSVSHNMMPNALLKSGLASAVREFIDKIDAHIIKVTLHAEGLNERIDSNVETVLYRVLQECVNNVIKHSGANILDISLMKDIDGISATIEDNGKGFEVSDKTKFEGIGLKNIISRINYLKGSVEWDSSPGNGTVVAIHVPVK